MTILQKLIEIANKEYDGHFTLMKFTTDWRCCFGTIDNCIKKRIDIYKIDASIDAQSILSADLETRILHGTKYLNCIKPMEYNNYSKRLYSFLAGYPDYRFVQIFENAKSLKEAIFTIDPMFLFKGLSSINGENGLKRVNI